MNVVRREKLMNVKTGQKARNDLVRRDCSLGKIIKNSNLL